MSGTPIPVVSFEEYETASVGASNPAPSWLPSAIRGLGWSLQATKDSTLTVLFADLSGSAGAQLPPIEGIEDTRKLPALATASIPIEQLFFSRKDLQLDVEVSDVSDRWAREWANSVVKMGTPESVPLGKGFAADGGAVIDMGRTLFRANWSSESASVLEVLASGTPNPSGELLKLSAPAGQA